MSARSVDDSLGLKLLPAVLSVAAGSADVISFLGLQLALLGGCGYLALAVFGSAGADPTGALGTLAGMCGVSAMAVQNALVQLSLPGAPTTAVLTTGVTKFTMDVGDVLLDRDPDHVAAARGRAAKLGRTIISFVVGAVLGAALFKAAGLESIALPTALALANGFRAGHDLHPHKAAQRTHPMRTDAVPRLKCHWSCPPLGAAPGSGL